MKDLLVLLAVFVTLTAFVPSTQATTTQLSTHVWKIDSGAEFSISNTGSTSYLFTWTDVNGTFTDIEDPSFVFSVNQTYEFHRTTLSHPFALTDDTLQVLGTDGSFSRTAILTQEIDDSTLLPLADFIADPAPTTDFIAWTPSSLDLGNFYYTCRISPHNGMTGRIEIVESSVPNSALSFGSLKGIYR
ncbi:MAG: hypothetical protein ACI9UK_001254 [Candidatus Krumholzibacteriia bacterium]|jgi:hypothetical protein